MGKPRLIILIRHAQSEGNKNREIHQTVPDHRVKLTPEGKKQAFEAGRKLRALLRPDDTLHFFTSPYRRTRETTEGILSSLTSDDPTPSPFPRHTIKVYEEPRLREQDFGNFQPDSKEMSRMWHERAEYGHFFYRIPSGESAADAYDRISGFNESLWRSFGEDDFASVCVLVTHGLMTRVFLMKWYHWSVEYFEDLRNINHCEFIVMQKNRENGKYILKNELRTWNQYKRERAEAAEATQSADFGSPVPRRKRWGDQTDTRYDGGIVRTPKRQNTADLFREDGSFTQQLEAALSRKANTPSLDAAQSEPNSESEVARESTQAAATSNDFQGGNTSLEVVDDTLASPTLQNAIMPTTSPARNSLSLIKRKKSAALPPFSPSQLAVFRGGRDGGGSRSGNGSRAGSSESESDPPSPNTRPEAAPTLQPPFGADMSVEQFSTSPQHPKVVKNSPLSPTSQEERTRQYRPPRSMSLALSGQLISPDDSGTGKGPAMADALGDQSDMEEEEDRRDVELQRTRKEEGGFAGSVR